MDKQNFIEKLHSEYASMFAVSKEDIGEMISRGFLVCDKEYLQYYITHYDAFKKKFEKFEDTKSLLTANELHEKLLKNPVIDIAETEIVKMADLGLLKRGEDFRDITIEADIIHKRNEDAVKGGIRNKIADIDANRETHVYLFSSDLPEKGYDFWFQLKHQLLEKLEELENEEDELGLDDIEEDDEEQSDEKKTKKENNLGEEFNYDDEEGNVEKEKKKRSYNSNSDRYIKEKQEEDARRLEELRKQEEARRTLERIQSERAPGASVSYDSPSVQTQQTTQADGNTQTYAPDTTSTSTQSENVYNSVNIPLSDGSYITIAPAAPGEGYKTFENNDTEAARMQAVLGSHDPETGKYQFMSQAGLSEVINYIKQTSADESVTYVPVVVTITKNDGQTTTLFNEVTNDGSVGDFYSAYYKNTEIPEYSNIDKKVQYAIGAVNFDDGTHDKEFSIKVDEYGNKTVEWTPPEYITSISPAVYTNISNYVQTKYAVTEYFSPKQNTDAPKYERAQENHIEPTSQQAESGPVKYYRDINYGAQQYAPVNASPTPEAQLRMMDSGAGAYIPENSLKTINTYREEHNEPSVDVNTITLQDVINSPRDIQREMAEAYVSTHAVTYEDLQYIESPVIGTVLEDKYARQISNSNVDKYPTWESARQAKVEYEVGIGTGIDSAEANVRKQYTAFEEKGYQPVYKPIATSPEYSGQQYGSNGSFNIREHREQNNGYPTSRVQENEIKKESPASVHQSGRSVPSTPLASAAVATAAVAAAIPVFVAFNNTDGSGKIAVALHEVKEYATTHVMSTTTKKNINGQVSVTPYYHSFVAEKEMQVARQYQEQKNNEATFYENKTINKSKSVAQPQYHTVKNNGQNPASYSSEKERVKQNTQPRNERVSPVEQDKPHNSGNNIRQPIKNESIQQQTQQTQHTQRVNRAENIVTENKETTSAKTINEDKASHPTVVAGGTKLEKQPGSREKQPSPTSFDASQNNNVPSAKQQNTSRPVDRSEPVKQRQEVSHKNNVNTSNSENINTVSQNRQKGVTERNNTVKPERSSSGNKVNKDIEVPKEIQQKYGHYVKNAESSKKAENIGFKRSEDAKKSANTSFPVKEPIANSTKAVITKGVDKSVVLAAGGMAVARQKVAKDVRTSIDKRSGITSSSASELKTSKPSVNSINARVGTTQQSEAHQPKKINTKTISQKDILINTANSQKETVKTSETKEKFNTISQQKTSHVIVPAAILKQVQNKDVISNNSGINNNSKVNGSKDSVVSGKVQNNTINSPKVINNNINNNGSVVNAANGVSKTTNNTFTKGKATTIPNTDVSASARGQKASSSVGTSVMDVPMGKVKVHPIGKARDVGDTVIKATAATTAVSTIPHKGVKTTINGHGKINVHIANANKRNTLGGNSNTPVISPKPKALQTITVNFEQKGITGRKVNTVLVLNSDKTGMIRTHTGKEVIEGKFRGFATDLGKANTKASSRNKQMAVAEAFERSRKVSGASIVVNGQKLTIDKEWLLHNSKNINSSISKFRLGKGRIAITQETAQELAGIVVKAQKEGALRTLQERAPRRERVKAQRASLSQKDVLSRDALQKYFLNSKSVIKEAEKKSRKSGRKKFWSAATAMVTMAPFLDNDMAAGLSVIRNFNRNIEIIARAGQRASIQQKGVNINKKFMRSFVGTGNVVIRTYRKNDLSSDGLKLGKNPNGVSRLQAINDIRIKVQSSENLRRSGVERMSVRELSKILQTGKLNSRVLTEEEKSILFNIVLLKTARSGRIHEINGVVLFNNKFKHIQLKGINGNYNFNKSKDISRALSELDKISLDGKFRTTLKGRRISQFSNRELRQLAKNKNLSQEDKELIKATLLLRAFYNEKKQNEKELAAFDKFKGVTATVRQVFRNIINGTDAGEGLTMVVRFSGRVKRSIVMVITAMKTLRAAAIERRIKKYAKTKGLRGKINNTRLSQWRQRKLAIRKDEGGLIKRTTRKAGDKVANRMKGVRTKATSKIKKKLVSSAAGKKFLKLRNSKVGKAINKVGGKALRVLRVGKGIGKVGIGIPLKGIALVQKIASLKAALIQALKKYAIIGLGFIVALTFVFTFLSVAYDSVSGFFYNNKSSFSVVSAIKVGDWSGLINSFSQDDEGDSTEYGSISATDTLINDRIQYCIGMDSAFKEYIESFYTNDDIIDAVTSPDNTKLKEEEKWWVDPANSNTFLETLKVKKTIGTTVGGINTGLHYSYYDGDGNAISMRSNAKDIVAVANTWIGTDLSAKGAYKTYVEKLWAYTHFVGYTLRNNYGNYCIYSCSSHETSAECHDNIVLYYCNQKKKGINSNGVDTTSKELYEELSNTEGSAIHNGSDIQLYFNETTQTVNGALNATTINKTIGNDTNAGTDKSILTRKTNVAAIDKTYKSQQAVFATGSTFSYLNGTTELIQMTYNFSNGMAADEASSSYSSSGTVSIDSTLSVADNVYKYLTQTLGMSTEAACGVMGNIYAESGFDITSVYTFTSGGTRYVFRGLCQWDDWNLSSDGRWCKGLAGALKGDKSKYMSYHYTDYNAKTKESLSDQLALIGYELQTTEKRVMTDGTVKDWKWGLQWTGLGAIKEGSGISGVEAATKTWAAIYERCYSGTSGVVQAQQKRIEAAKSYYNKYKTGTVKAGTTIYYTWPVKENFVISALYGTYPSGGAHKGLDINIRSPWNASGSNVSKGKTVYAAQSGKVVAAATGAYSSSSNSGYGTYVIIEHSNGDRTLYAHMAPSGPLVSVGQTVSQGQAIGYIDSTGNSTGPHLHFELRQKVDGEWVRVNPELYIVDSSVSYKLTNNVATQKGESKNKTYKKDSASGTVVGDTYTYTSGSGGTGITGGIGGGAGGKVNVLFRTAGVSKYGTTEKGSWAWVESTNGCTRHEPTFHNTSTTNDVTSKVLSSGASLFESPINSNNAVTLFPESTIDSVKFYSSAPCSNYGTVYYSQKTTTVINGTSYTTYAPQKAYYCRGHLSGCSEQATSTSNVEVIESVFHTLPAHTSLSYTTANNIKTYTMVTDAYSTYSAAWNAIPLSSTSKAFTSVVTGNDGNTINSSLENRDVDVVSGATVNTESQYVGNSGWHDTEAEALDALLSVSYDTLSLKIQSSWDVDETGNLKLKRMYLYYAYRTTYRGYYYLTCLGHQITKERTVECKYCTGYCCGHEMTEYCTGHIDLDVGVVTLYADETAENNIINLGVAKTATVTTTDGNYQAREENGKKSGDAVTVTTLKSNSKDAHDYIFTGNDVNDKLNVLTNYVFKEFDTGIATNSFPLPGVDSQMEYNYIDNDGSFVVGEDIVNGLKFIKALVDGDGTLAIEAHNTLSDKNDYDGDNKITLMDILAKAYASFAYEKFPDYNDDIALIGKILKSYDNFINMPTVAQKNTKQVHFIGFYEYVISGVDAGLKIDATGEYVDTGNIARVHESMKDDWLQLYQIEFPGAYNAVASDKEVQKLAFNIAASNWFAIKANMGITVAGTQYSEFTHNNYIFMDSIYKFPETITQNVTDPTTGTTKTVVTTKPRGTGFLSAWDENDKEKTTNCLGKPAYYANHSDIVNFSLEWGATFLKDLGFTQGANKYTEILNTSNYKDAYDFILNYYDASTNSFKITEADIPQWIVDTYDGNVKKAMFKFNMSKISQESLIKEMKSAYLRKVLMSESCFVNGADTSWDKAGTAISTDFKDKVCMLKSGDIVGIGDEVYLVLYQDSGIKDALNYYDNGEPIYTGSYHASAGKVYLLAIGDVDQASDIQDNEIHIFAYSLELLNVKRDSVWLYMPTA